VKRRLIRPLLVACTMGAVVTGVAVTSAAGADDDSPTDRNVALLDQARRQTTAHDYAALIEVRWVDASGAMHEANTKVRYHDGVVEIGEDGHVFVSDANGLVFDGAAWSTAPSRAKGAPRADDKYEITRTEGPIVAGSATTLLEARRDRDGALVERFYLDDDTDVVLQRESFDDDGDVRRALAFTRIWRDVNAPGAEPAAAARPPSKSPKAIGDVDAPYRAPKHAGDGFELVGRWRHADSVTQLAYSDGLLSASVFEQPGRLNWGGLPAGGEPDVVNGRRAVAYSLPVGDALVWERAGVVYTCVGDAPRTELVGLASGVSKRASDGTATRLARVVLAPFGW
jgi:hypothetical protein